MVPPYSLEFSSITVITNCNYILVFQNFYLMSAFLLDYMPHEGRDDVDFILYFTGTV